MASSVASRTGGFPGIAALDREADVLRAGLDALRDRLPSSWTLQERGEPAAEADRRIDAELRVRTPVGEELIVLVEAKRLINTRDVPALLESLQGVASAYGSDQAVVPVLVARYLAPPTRDRIAAAGAG